MSSTSLSTDEARQHTLLFLTTPEPWQHWPFLPVVRCKPGQEEELGVVDDALHAVGVAGHSCTVWLVNIFLLPLSLDALFASPKEVFDTPDELVQGGWTVDSPSPPT